MSSGIAAEAGEALAIHHEHRLRDFVRRIASPRRRCRPRLTERRTDAVKWRLNRLERRLAEQPMFGLLDQDPGALDAPGPQLARCAGLASGLRGGLRCSAVWAPNLVNRSTRPSVSISF